MPRNDEPAYLPFVACVAHIFLLLSIEQEGQNTGNQTMVSGIRWCMRVITHTSTKVLAATFVQWKTPHLRLNLNIGLELNRLRDAAAG
jgi:hypothetical protein